MGEQKISVHDADELRVSYIIYKQSHEEFTDDEVLALNVDFIEWVESHNLYAGGGINRDSHEPEGIINLLRRGLADIKTRCGEELYTNHMSRRTMLKAIRDQANRILQKSRDGGH